MRVAAGVEYDGSEFSGWQIQHGQRTVQDCVERALTRLHLFDRDKPLRPWLYRILRNLFISQLRQTARRGAAVSLDAVSEAELARPPEQASRIVLKDIGEAVQQLPEPQREVLLLISLEEFSYKETAEILDIPIGTVMSRLSRARQRLSSIMQGAGQSKLRQVK